MATRTVFGDVEQVAIYTCYGCPPIGGLAEIVGKVVDFLGMTRDGPPIVKKYPKPDGSGGTGEMVIQPFTESGLLANTYIKANKTRLIIESCVPFDSNAVAKLLKRDIGPVLRVYHDNF